MIYKNIMALLKKNLWFFVIFVLLASTSGILSGCKEKASAPAPSLAPPKNIGQCEVLDTLPDDIAKPVEVNFGDKAKFLGITTQKSAQNKLAIYYYWQVLDQLGPYTEAFVIFADENDKQLSGNNHALCNKKPFGELKGKYIKEIYTIDIPQIAIGKKVNISVGIFSPDLKPENARLKIKSAGKTVITDNNTRAIVEEIKF
ncbi:MAG: hypothetical protein FJ240_08495 [Nitrospira sp.]|nr:hypothetical protein [Nitrospira sp.]